MDAMEYVRGCLASPHLNLREVAEGSGVGESWLRMFKRGKIPDPSYHRVKALADYFLRVGGQTPTPAESPRVVA